MPAEGVDFKEGLRAEGCPGFVEGKKVDFKGRPLEVRNTHNGFTAFHWCCQNGSDGAVKAAEEAGAQLEMEKKADAKAKDKTNPAPDHVKCMQLLLEWGSNPTLLDFMGRTGRDLAALKGNFKLVEALDIYLAENPWKEDECAPHQRLSARAASARLFVRAMTCVLDIASCSETP